MRLADRGKFIFGLAVSLFSAAVILTSFPVFILGILAMSYLVLAGLRFRYELIEFARSVTCEYSPRRAEALNGEDLAIDITLTNHSSRDFRVVEFRSSLSVTILEKETGDSLTLGANAKQHVRSTLHPTLAGRFESYQCEISVEQKRRLFKKTVTLPSQFELVSRPRVEQTVVLTGIREIEDLAVDRRLRGAGTEFLGIRPASVFDDFQRMDWKATARTGRPMIREFYSEKDPTIVLLVDASASMRTAVLGASVFSAVIAEVANFLFTARTAVGAIGLIMFDENKVLRRIEPKVGQENRELILREMLKTDTKSNLPKLTTMDNNMSYELIERDTRSFEKLGRDSLSRERLNAFAKHVLPYYERALRKRLTGLRRKGVFAALEQTLELDDNSLLLILTDGSTNMSGLYEGVKTVVKQKHRAIVVILSRSKPTSSSEFLSRLKGIGVGVAKCQPRDLWSAVNSEIIAMRHRKPLRWDIAYHL